MGERRCPDLALVGPVGAVRHQVDAELALGRLDRGVDLAGGLRTYTEFVSMTTIVRCPRTGRACSEGACRERHWCRQLPGLSHRGLPLKRKFRPRCCAK